jgi:predicted dehydrogenase
MTERLGIGFIGSGFVARFHAQAFLSVRDADIVAICSRNHKTASELAAMCRELGLGEPKLYSDPRQMARDPRVKAVWVLAPNNLRVETVEAIADEVKSGRAELRGIAIEKPLARNLAEATRVLQLVTEAGIPHGYLENQIYAPAVARGKQLLWERGAAIAGEPYLARCAEEHSGPHRAWFWRGDLQGGGVLNDMMCHSLAAGWFLLTGPNQRLSALAPKAVTARIASLKWTRPQYAERLKQMWAQELEVDYARAPAEDYATAQVVFETPGGNIALVEATTSWSFVGPGLRLTFEVLGPEYMLQANSLEGEGKIFFSRNVTGPAGEDIVEKQNAEQGLMPFVADEAHSYGYIAEDRHMARCFLRGETPLTTLEDGLRITELLMAAYLSAELHRTVTLPAPELESFTPAVARSAWDPKSIARGAD